MPALLSRLRLGEFSATIFCGCWRAPALPGWRCVCAAEIDSGGTGSGEAERSTAPASIPSAERGQGLAFVRRWGPCASGCARLAGEVGCEQSRVTAGPCGPARAGPCAARRLLPLLAVGAPAWERPQGTAGACGAVPAALLLFPKGGSSPHRLEPWGGWPSLGRCRGGLERGAPLWGAGLPFSPPSLPPGQPKLRLGVQHMAAAMGLSRAVVAGEWESKHLCAGLGAAASNGFDGAVVVCCLENLHSAPCPRGPRHRRPWRYLNITTEG